MRGGKTATGREGRSQGWYSSARRENGRESERQGHADISEYIFDGIFKWAPIALNATALDLRQDFLKRRFSFSEPRAVSPRNENYRRSVSSYASLYLRFPFFHFFLAFSLRFLLHPLFLLLLILLLAFAHRLRLFTACIAGYQWRQLEFPDNSEDIPCERVQKRDPDQYSWNLSLTLRGKLRKSRIPAMDVCSLTF